MKSTAKPRGITNFWPFYALAFGIVFLYQSMPALQLNRALDADRSGNAQALVHTKTFKHPKNQEPTYGVAYAFQVGDAKYRGHHDCQCVALRHVQEGQTIPVRYALTDPGLNRPAQVRYSTTWLRVGAAAGWLLTIGGALASLYQILMRGKGRP